MQIVHWLLSVSTCNPSTWQVVRGTCGAPTASWVFSRELAGSRLVRVVVVFGVLNKQTCLLHLDFLGLTMICLKAAFGLSCAGISVGTLSININNESPSAKQVSPSWSRKYLFAIAKLDVLKAELVKQNDCSKGPLATLVAVYTMPKIRVTTASYKCWQLNFVS